MTAPHSISPGTEHGNIRVTVCDRCLQSSCWQGIFMCDEARTAGTTIKTIAELRKLNLENEDYWT